SNEAKLEERSRLEDRIYKIFTVTISIFGLFLGYIMWNSNRVQSDLVNKVDTARNSLEQQYNTALRKQGDEFQTLKSRLWQEQNASYVSAFIKFADMRQNLLDLEGALMSAIVAFIKATEGGFRDREAMLVRMDTAIRRATIAQKRLPEMLLSE